MNNWLHKLIFRRLLPLVLYRYERHLKYRIIDAWGYATAMKVLNKGKNVRFQGYTRIINPEKLVVGDDVRVGMNCYFHALGGISIGKGTIISRNVVIYSASHSYKEVDYAPYNNKYDLRSVNIGRGVWIGMNVSIVPGVTIGDGAVIAMGTTVSSNVMDGEIVGSQPTRTLNVRSNQAKFKELLSSEKFFSRKWPNS